MTISLKDIKERMSFNRGAHMSAMRLRNRSTGGYIATIIFLLLFASIMVLPMVYVVVNAFKPLSELWIFPPRFFVYNPTGKNFSDLVELMNTSTVPFSRYIFNTVFISICGTTGNVLLSSCCAYVFARRRMVGGKQYFGIVRYALMFVGGSVTGIPNFLIMASLGWIDKYWSYIIPAMGTSMGLYLMKQFMEQMVPVEVIEAARIDGCGEMKILFRIVMPMVKSGWVTLIIFSFQGLWNTGGTNYIYEESLKTFNYAMSQITAAGITRAGVSAASSLLMMIVPITVFLIAQSNVLETMSTSGMKD